MKEAAVEHLKSCNDKKAIAAYQKKIAEDKEKEKRKAKAVETQEDVMAFKTWEHNGRQVFYCDDSNSDSFYRVIFLTGPPLKMSLDCPPPKMPRLAPPALEKF